MPSQLAKRLIEEARSVHMPGTPFMLTVDLAGANVRRCQACGEEWPCLVDRICHELERSK